jgi:hypothetical protein
MKSKYKLLIIFLLLLLGMIWSIHFQKDWHIKGEPFITARIIRHGIRNDLACFYMNGKLLGTNTISHAALEYFYEPTK